MADKETEKDLETLVAELDGSNRRHRQESARELARRAREGVSDLFEYAGDVIDGLDRPEAQTRWELLDVLSEMAKEDPGCVEEAFEGAEASLFDEESSAVRLAAFRFLTSFGATEPARSAQVWPILDEAVQCYHGDPEYRDMLGCLLEFAGGSIAPDVADALHARIDFDAQNGRGYIKAFSCEIVEALNKR
ncbi:hypothetical protein J2S71_001470 [Olsenella profusa DSM 13989]|uniref:HEAT repeat protein n=1 Tax=Olsenella profusa F0195 TaxID=1125712 RepID=U2TN63_9ACTN|nr:hypothetical protein [Olsenella profusa]ERL07865.1 hypothetical protein HMPREF1316_1771 [Olsenella profusa F0195]MDP9859774.1 hypothetical protein [Olsenella profusa DSM 13989]